MQGFSRFSDHSVAPIISTSLADCPVNTVLSCLEADTRLTVLRSQGEKAAHTESLVYTGKSITPLFRYSDTQQGGEGVVAHIPPAVL